MSAMGASSCVELELASGPQERANALFDQFDSQAGFIRDGHVTLTDTQFRGMVHDRKVFRKAIRISLLYIEVGDCRIQLQRGGSANRTRAEMRRNPHVVRFGHGRDLFGLHDPTRISNVRLKNVGGVHFHNPAEAVARVKALSGGDRDVHVLRDLLQRFHVGWVYGLFDPPDGAFLEFVAQPDDRVGGQFRAYVQQQVRLRPDRAADGFYNLDRLVFRIRIDAAQRNMPQVRVGIEFGDFTVLFSARLRTAASLQVRSNYVNGTACSLT